MCQMPNTFLFTSLVLNFFFSFTSYGKFFSSILLLFVLMLFIQLVSAHVQNVTESLKNPGISHILYILPNFQVFLLSERLFCIWLSYLYLYDHILLLFVLEHSCCAYSVEPFSLLHLAPTISIIFICSHKAHP